MRRFLTVLVLALSAARAASAETSAVVVSSTTESLEAQLKRAADAAGAGAQQVFDGGRGSGRTLLVVSLAPQAVPPKPVAKAEADAKPSAVTVRPGDTLTAIAAKNGLTLAQLVDLNPQITNPNLIHPGESVNLTGTPSAHPAPLQGQSYLIRPGDTLWDISQRSGVSVRALADANGIANPSLIYAGRTLHIPDGSEPPRTPKPQEPAVPATQTEAAVLSRARSVGATINDSGGYRFDGRNDCYGYVRRVWDPVLAQQSKPPLPVADYPSPNWRPITNWNQLMPGDVLATADGHQWGGQWHGGLYAGMQNGRPMVEDNTGSRSVSTHPNEVFGYYYVPTHDILAGAN